MIATMYHYYWKENNEIVVQNMVGELEGQLGDDGIQWVWVCLSIGEGIDVDCDCRNGCSYCNNVSIFWKTALSRH